MDPEKENAQQSDLAQTLERETRQLQGKPCPECGRGGCWGNCATRGGGCWPDIPSPKGCW